MASLLSRQISGIELADSIDPQGQTPEQESAQLIFRKPDGTPVTSGVFVSRHATGKLRLVIRAADSPSADFFELDPETGHVIVVQM
jgi:hypothetical protein